MNILIEEAYNIMEALIVSWFVISYFSKTEKYSVRLTKSIVFVIMTIYISIVSLFNIHWFYLIILSSAVLISIISLFYKENLSEKIIISCTSVLLLALSDICAFTLIGHLLDVNYSELVSKSDFSRMLSVLTSKSIYIIAASAILFLKKKYNLFLHKREVILMIITIMLSGVEISLIRTIISTQKQYYNVFLIILLCVISLNVILYYTMIYIGKKNTDEKNYSLMRMQLELQSENIQALEQKYDETAKIRHDIKNYLSVALNMAEQKKYQDLVQYLETLSEEKINAITSYINIKRNVLGAVLNSKLSKAESLNINIQCCILSEFEAISDMDIGILFANLLDNAIEACEKNKISSEIIVKTWIEAGYYFLEISNTVETDILSSNPDLKTNKNLSELHGVGLRSVRDIVKKYDGMINFGQKGNVFKVYVSLENNSL